MLALTRQAIINDDMGAFNDIATRLGRAAALTIEVDVYALPRREPAHGRRPRAVPRDARQHRHGGAALTVATVEADRVLMAQQQDPAKNEYPRAPPGGARAARRSRRHGARHQPGAVRRRREGNARNQEPNKVVGLYRDIVDTARLTGTTRYSFADPAIAPVIEVAFLNGQQLRTWRCSRAGASTASSGRFASTTASAPRLARRRP
jgi:hypothetical protein